MKKILLYLILLTVSFTLYAEDSKEGQKERIKFAPFQVSLFHPYQLFEKDFAVYGIRLNLLYSENEAVYGLDLIGYNVAYVMYGIQAGFYNEVFRDVAGIQLGIIGNEAGSFTGIQVTSGANTNKWYGRDNQGTGESAGLQLALIYNSNDNCGLTGLQAAGLWNHQHGEFTGIQAAGLFNVAMHRMAGIQFAGLLNISDSFMGLEVAPVNVCGVFYGLQAAVFYNNTIETACGIQLGFFNESKKVYGLQAGFINDADDVCGVQIGVINITRKMRGIQIGLCNIIYDGAVPFLPLVNASFSF